MIWLRFYGINPARVTQDLHAIIREHVGWMRYRFDLDFMGQMPSTVTQDLHAIKCEHVGWM